MNLLGSVYDNDDHSSRDGDIKRIYSRYSFCLFSFNQQRRPTDWTSLISFITNFYCIICIIKPLIITFYRFLSRCTLAVREK